MQEKSGMGNGVRLPLLGGLEALNDELSGYIPYDIVDYL